MLADSVGVDEPVADTFAARATAAKVTGSHASEWPLTWSSSQMDHVNNVPCPLTCIAAVIASGSAVGPFDRFGACFTVAPLP